MKWLPLSLLSGLAAAFNGLFAKLVTTELTTNISISVADFFGVSIDDAGARWIVEGVVRAVFFGLNLGFNAVMWALFTAALAKGSSATKVSVVNTSANFLLTAFLGFLVFGEKLPGMWWFGATLLVGGNVVIGRRDKDEGVVKGDGYVALGQDEREGEREVVRELGEIGAEGSGSVSGSGSGSEVEVEGELRGRKGKGRERGRERNE
ncbi:hypothetical protein BDZ91DRAFT_699624 [Kalaharituber pfeilii]|nr:hypothetical protein BDZ91DRAFT_699624 [Kalaharituber pfeilii]